MKEAKEYSPKKFNEIIGDENIICFSDKKIESGKKIKNKFNNFGIISFGIENFCEYYKNANYIYKVKTTNNTKKILEHTNYTNGIIIKTDKFFEIYGELLILREIDSNEIFENYDYCLKIIKNLNPIKKYQSVDQSYGKFPLFREIPKANETDEYFFELIKLGYPYLHQIKNKKLNICLKAIEHNDDNYQYVPNDMKTYKFIFEGIKHNFLLFLKDYIPHEFYDCQMYANILYHSGIHFDSYNFFLEFLKMIPVDYLNQIILFKHINEKINEKRFIKGIFPDILNDLEIEKRKIIEKEFIKKKITKEFYQKQLEKNINILEKIKPKNLKNVLTEKILLENAGDINDFNLMYIPNSFKSKKFYKKFMENFYTITTGMGDFMPSPENLIRKFSNWDEEMYLILISKYMTTTEIPSLKKLNKVIPKKFFYDLNFWKKAIKLNNKCILQTPRQYVNKIVQKGFENIDFLSEETKYHEIIHYYINNFSANEFVFSTFDFEDFNPLKEVETLIEKKNILENSDIYEKLLEKVEHIYKKLENYHDYLEKDIKRYIDVLILFHTGNSKNIYFIEEDFYYLVRNLVKNIPYYQFISHCSNRKKELKKRLNNENKYKINFDEGKYGTVKNIETFHQKENKNCIFVNYKYKLKKNKLTYDIAMISSDIAQGKYNLNMLENKFELLKSFNKNYYKIDNYSINSIDKQNYKNLLFNENFSDDFNGIDFFYILLHRYKLLRDNNFNIQIDFPSPGNHYLKLARYIPAYLEEVLEYQENNELKIVDIVNYFKKKYMPKYDKTLANKINKNKIIDSILERVEWKKNLNSNNTILFNYNLKSNSEDS